jgi:hypothetical protein
MKPLRGEPGSWGTAARKIKRGNEARKRTMVDRLGVTHWPVNVTPVDGPLLVKLKARLDVMEREARHLLTAVADMKNGIARRDTRLLTSGVMNSRNWTLSVVMSHCYVQTMLGKNAGSSGFPGMLHTGPGVQAHLLFPRASEAGVEDARRDGAP